MVSPAGNDQSRTLRQGIGAGDNDPLTRLLERGRKGLESSLQEFDKLYKPIDPKTIEAANEFNDQMAQLQTNFENLSREIGGPLLTNLNLLLGDIDKLSKWHDGKIMKVVDNIMSGQWYNDIMADATKKGMELRNWLREHDPIMKWILGPKEDVNSVKPDKATGGDGHMVEGFDALMSGKTYDGLLKDASRQGKEFRNALRKYGFLPGAMEDANADTPQGSMSGMLRWMIPDFLTPAGPGTKSGDKTSDPAWILKNGQPSYLNTTAPSLYNPLEPVQHAQAARRPNKFSQYERKYRLPAGLLNSTYQQESGGGKHLFSPKGALGPFQLMPGTAHDLGLHGNDVFDLDKSSEAAAKYYRMLLDRYHGDLPKAVAAYNWGMGHVDKFGLSLMPKETQKYLPAVLKGVSGWHSSLDDYAGGMSSANTDSFAAMQHYYALMGTPPALPASAGSSGDSHVHQTNHIVIHAPGGDPAEIDRRLSLALTTHSQQAQDMLASDIF